MSRSKGFTVIELVIVLTIVTILTAITLPMGINWLTEYRFSSAARSLSNAVLMARMRGIENRAVFTIYDGRPTTTDAPFSTACPGMIFSTGTSATKVLDHGFSQPNPPVTNALVYPVPATALPTFWSPVAPCRCVKSLASATPPTPGDTVMISGLDRTTSMNGCEFEVITVTPPNKFAVQHAVSPTLGDTNGPDTKGTVRNLTAPGRLRIVPAVNTPAPGPLDPPLPDDEESFMASAYTIKEEASSIIFRYDIAKFEVTFYPGNPSTDPPPGTLLDRSSASKKFAEIRFDNRGFPKSTLVGNGVPNATTANTIILIAEKASTLGKKDPRRVRYLISTTGKVNVQAWED
jgi:prepilin-type N-terminal cleavage/methylation domain-containing protein